MSNDDESVRESLRHISGNARWNCSRICELCDGRRIRGDFIIRASNRVYESDISCGNRSMRYETQAEKLQADAIAKVLFDLLTICDITVMKPLNDALVIWEQHDATNDLLKSRRLKNHSDRENWRPETIFEISTRASIRSERNTSRFPLLNWKKASDETWWGNERSGLWRRYYREAKLMRLLK